MWFSPTRPSIQVWHFMHARFQNLDNMDLISSPATLCITYLAYKEMYRWKHACCCVSSKTSHKLYCRVIIDFTEIMSETPSSCRSQSATFSSYKNHNTAKGLFGISPNSYPSFVSSLYGGRQVTKRSQRTVVYLICEKQEIKLWLTAVLTLRKTCPLNNPPFLNGKDQHSLEEEVATRKIASVRVHVERAIARIKNFRILHQVVLIAISKDLDKIWTVCSYLILFLLPIIVDKPPQSG